MLYLSQEVEVHAINSDHDHDSPLHTRSVKLGPSVNRTDSLNRPSSGKSLDREGKKSKNASLGKELQLQQPLGMFYILKFFTASAMLLYGKMLTY